MTTTETPFDPAKVEAFAGRLMPILTGGLLSYMVDIGHRTGLFAAAAQGPATSQGLADRAGLQERYVREWLGAVTTGGIVEYDPAGRTFFLPPEHAALLVGNTSMAPLAGMNTVMAKYVPDLVRVFREGGGIPYAEYCPEFSEAMDAIGRGAYDQFLVDAFLPLAPGLTDALTAGVNVADLACGSGHAIVLLGQAFPASTFTGYDLDGPALERARSEAADAGLANVSFVDTDIASLRVDQPLDAVFMFDALHDQVDPAAVLASARAAMADDATFLLREPRAGDTLEENLQSPTAPIQYSISTLHCLTVSLAHGGAGIGTAFGEQHARRLLTEAGFEDPAVHPAPGDPLDAVYVTRPAA
ncbi:MAG TPA: class I SAM-dependent methyltransferase [Acidimicrobiales bacterium]|nr:class I SAM-dependent methyltransferase [Acidimicrobiales bacterium]